MKILFIKKGDTMQVHPSSTDSYSRLSDAIYETDVKNTNMRTLKQNASYWKWVAKIADALNAGDYSIEQVVRMDTIWNKDKVDAMIIKPIIKSLFGINSTTKLQTKDYTDIIRVAVLGLRSRGVVIPKFPSKEDMDE